MTKPKPAKAIDFGRLTLTELQRAFDCHYQTAASWHREGCPRRDDKFYDLPKVIQWHIDRAVAKYDTPDSLKDEKTRKEIERLEIIIARLRNDTIDRGLHERILTSRATALRTFWTQAAGMNANFFVGLKFEEAREKLNEFVRKGTEAYLQGSPVEDAEDEGDR